MLSRIKNNWKERLPSSLVVVAAAADLFLWRRGEENKVQNNIFDMSVNKYTFRDEKIYNMINYNDRWVKCI